MKQKMQFLINCGSGICGMRFRQTKDYTTDSLLTDASVMDTADRNAEPADTAVMRIDSISQDAGSVTA
jgi:hypothetical protein